ncbi:hypothetical protein C8R45DRAFT_1001051 [Mycena sanguinolenta]|nr:hypothetical protein C8R45DRAFT_1001051 [Mycena sanguinolenta]
MGAIGLWLWSNPSKFGTLIGDCNPSLSVLGAAVPFSSLGLRIFSLALYSFLVIPGINLALPLLFFLALHITYNKFRPRLEEFSHFIRRIPSSTGTLFRRRRTRNHDTESISGIPATDIEWTPSFLDHTTFLITALVCLLIINIILLVDIELTLRRNRHDQSIGEDQWGFGQVLALVLLVIPLRDTKIMHYILYAWEDQTRRPEVKRTIQRSFNKHLEEAVKNDTLVGHDFVGLIEQGADPNVQLDGVGQIVTLLQLAASKGNDNLVQFILDNGVEDTEGWAFCAAARQKHPSTVGILGVSSAPWRGLEKALQDTNSDAPRVALEWLSEVSAQVAQPKFWEGFHSIIPLVAELLSQRHGPAIQAALKCLARLGLHRELQQDIRSVIPMVVELLKDDDSDARRASIECLASLGAHSMQSLCL